MDEKFDLHSKLQWEGVFGDATKPDEKFAGTLSSDGKRLELVTRAELVTPTPAMFMGTDESPAPDIVHGYTSHGACTIIGLQQIDVPGLLNYATGRGIRWRRFRVTGACTTVAGVFVCALNLALYARQIWSAHHIRSAK